MFEGRGLWCFIYSRAEKKISPPRKLPLSLWVLCTHELTFTSFVDFFFHLQANPGNILRQWLPVCMHACATHDLHIHLNTNLTIVCSFVVALQRKKSLGECVCQKVTQSAHHAERAQTSTVLWGACVCVWGCLNGVGWMGKGGGSSVRAKQRKNLIAGCLVSEFHRSPPLYAYHRVKPEPAAGLHLVPLSSGNSATLWKVSNFNYSRCLTSWSQG